MRVGGDIMDIGVLARGGVLPHYSFAAQITMFRAALDPKVETDSFCL